MATLVMKFGGTSVGSAKALRQVLSIVGQEREKWSNVAVITSAIGGVTDLLVKLVNSARQADIDSMHQQLEHLREKHYAAAREFIDPNTHFDELQAVDAQIDSLISDLKAICGEIVQAKSADGRLRDASLSMGERLMSRILAAIFRVNGIPAEKIDASEMIVTDHRHQNAQPQFEASQANAKRMILPLFELDIIPVVTGYIGATPEGVITTLGRGGSDYSATYLASLIDADEVWIWTDVDGVMSADPRKIKDALVMPTISYEEVSEFAHFGAKVLHPRAVEPLMAPHIPLRVCNTFNPEVDGTRINSQQADGPRHLNAVTAIDGVLVFAPNSGEASADNMVAMQTLIDDILSGQFSQEAQPIITVDSHAGRLLCYVVPTTARRTAMQESVEVLSAAFGEKYPDFAWRVEPISIVAAIGVVEIQQTVQVLNAVKSAKAELLAMGHGSPQCCLLAVRPEQSIRVMKRLHRMVVTIQANLRYAENDPQRPAAVNVPTTRRKQNGRQRRRGGPPHRVIPL